MNGSHQAISKHPWSLATQLTLWYAGTAIAIVSVVIAILYWALIANLDRQDDQFLVDEAHIIQDLLAERPEYVDAIRQEIEWESAARRLEKVYVRLIDGSGKTIVETPEMARQLPGGLFPSPVDSSKIVGGANRISSDGTPYRVISVQHTRTSTDSVRTIQIAMDRVQQYGLMASYRLTLLVVSLAALIACSLAAYTIAHRGWARALKREIHVLYFACRDPRTPWYAKLLVGMVAAYALSPIDLIPDPIPIIGYLDDLILLPLGILLARKLIPSEVLNDCRRRADAEPEAGKPSWLAAIIIVLIWLLTLAGLIYVAKKRFAPIP